MRGLATLQPRILNVRVGTQALTTRTHRLTGRRLQRRNKRYLADHPLCVKCTEQGRVAAAQEVDHIVPLHKGGVDGEPNLQGLCRDCHKSKTAQEARERGWGS